MQNFKMKRKLVNYFNLFKFSPSEKKLILYCQEFRDQNDHSKHVLKNRENDPDDDTKH